MMPHQRHDLAGNILQRERAAPEVVYDFRHVKRVGKVGFYALSMGEGRGRRRGCLFR